MAPQERLRMRNESGRSLVIQLVARAARRGLQKQRDRQGNRNSLKRWGVLTRLLDDGRLCTSNNAAERELRALAVGRRNRALAGSDEGGGRAAVLYPLIATAKLKDIDPQARLADVLARFRHSAPVLPKVPRNTAPARPVNTSAPANVVVENGSNVLSNETRCQIAWICGLNISHGASTIG